MRNGNDVGKSAEDYLESMIVLKEKNGYIRSVDIAEHLGVTKPSVSNAMKRLREENYIEMNRSGFITLTEKGMETAAQIGQIAEQAVQMAGKGLTDENRDVFYSVLNQIASNLQTISEDGLA